MDTSRLDPALVAAEKRAEEAEDALAEIHRVTGRGDGHGKPSDTAACVIGAFVTGGIGRNEDLADARREGREEAQKRWREAEAVVRESLLWLVSYAEERRRFATKPEWDMGVAYYSTREATERINAAIAALESAT